MKFGLHPFQSPSKLCCLWKHFTYKLCDINHFIELKHSNEEICINFFLTLSILDLTNGFLPKYVQPSELRAKNSCMSSQLVVSGMLLSC